MIHRQVVSEIVRLANQFKAIVITGPRQSGKTTLVKSLFQHKPYVSLENPDTRNFAITDPRGFLGNYPNGAILDEVQRTPDIFSYLQGIIDQSKEKCQFILTGSNNFLLQQSISQSLAGRAAYVQLHPFTYGEIKNDYEVPPDDELICKGFYPPVYDQQINSSDWSKIYISTYVEKDVRQIKNISDLLVFERFLSLLAGRCGQELNMSALAVEVGADSKTIQSWIGILEGSYIIFLLKPYHRNFNKTIVKRPKIYFFDTSIACSLLRIAEPGVLKSHPLRGALFENMVVADIFKTRIHSGLSPDLFYWREKSGYEIDLIIDHENTPLPVEIKSGKTLTSDFFKNLTHFRSVTGTNKSILLYSGDESLTRSDGTIISNWKLHDQILNQQNLS
jgi:uncharacterized protein